MRKTFLIFLIFLLWASMFFVNQTHAPITLGAKIDRLITQTVRNSTTNNQEVSEYWFLLHRQSQKEELLWGVAGSKDKSELIREFSVKVGQKDRPTPLPVFFEREYWLIVDKFDSSQNPETSPYFLTLDIPAPDSFPYGPSPYLECNGQCNWGKPGKFGLHGIGGMESRLSSEDPGSSGCIRHSDAEIAYLYNLLNPQNSSVRYYIEEN